MDVPPPLPPLPRARFSPFLLIALLLVLLAVVARTVLSGDLDLDLLVWQRLGLAAAGIVAAITALVFSLIALADRRRLWALAFLPAGASIVIVWYQVADLRQPVARLVHRTLGSAPEGVAFAQQPIPQAKDTPTAAQFTPAAVAWGEETIVRPYLEHGRHNTAWDALAEEFLRGTVLVITRCQTQPGVEHLRLLGAEIQRTGCDDPWVNFLIHRLEENDPDYRVIMEKDAAAITAAGYAPFAVWFAQAQALEAARAEDPQAASAHFAHCMQSLRDALVAKPLATADYRVWCRLFFDEPAVSVLKEGGDATCRIVESVPGLEEWFTTFVRGRGEVEQAWLARGSGWSNSVTPDQWQRFGEHLGLARTALERSMALQPSAPEPATAMMTVELGTNGLLEMRQRFDRAVKAQFDYLPAYEKLRYGMLPRWFGSEEAGLAFGRNCLATQRWDTCVPWQMLRAVRAAAKDTDDADAFYRNRAPWREVDEMIEGYLAHGDPTWHSYVLSVKAVLAARRGMDAAVAQSLKELDYHIDPEAAENWNLSVEWAARMAALTGPAAGDVLAAEREDDDHPEKALERLLAAQKRPGLLPLVADYLDRKVEEVGAMVALKRTAWQPLTPPPDLAGWRIEHGQGRSAPPALFEITPDNAGAIITRVEPVGDTWELRGEFELTPQRAGRSEAALFCGPPGEQEGHGFSLRFWVRPRGSPGISLARGFRDLAISKSTDFERTTKFMIRLAGHRLRVWANDGQWFADQPLPEGVKIDSGAVLGLGSTDGGSPPVQFRNLEWRAPKIER